MTSNLDYNVPRFVSHPDPSIYTRGRGLFLDVEAAGPDKASPSNPASVLVLACWCFNGVWKAKWGDEFDQHELLEDIAQADFVVAHNCFSADTEYLTQDGTKRFSETCGTEQKVWTELGWKPAKIRNYGKSKLTTLRVVPYNRSRSSIQHEIKVTPNHRWIADRIALRNSAPRRSWRRIGVDGYVQTKDLRVGDRIVSQAPTVTPSENSDGFRHGLIFADGTLRRRVLKSGRKTHQIRLCGAKAKYKDAFKHYTYPRSAKGDPVVNYYVTDNNCKDLPPAGASLQYVADFIHGWQLLDGTNTHTKCPYTRIVQTSKKEYAEWLKENAASVGWLVTGYNQYLHSGDGLFGSKGSVRMYSVTLSKDPNMAWTVVDIDDTDDSLHDVYCAEVEGIDRFTLKHGIYTGNCKYELAWLVRCGLDLRSVLIYDTMLADWVIGGNRWSNLKLLALDKCLGRHGLGIKDPTGRLVKAGVDVRDIPRAWLEDYCFEDARACVDLFEAQTKILVRDNLLHIQYARCLLTPVLVDMEAQGLCLDKERVYQEYEQTAALFSERKREMDEMTGGINFRSRPQLGVFLYDTLGFEEIKKRGKPDRTPAGARKTDVTTLEKLVAKNKRQRKFKELLAELTTLSTALTKGLNFFKGVCDQQDGIFYGVLNQGTTANHRLSSSGKSILLPQPNGKTKKASAQLQNIDRDYKSLFKAKRDGWLVCEADGGSLEFRAAAELCQDPVAIHDIATGVDVHTFTATTLSAAGQLTDRQGAKPDTFKPLYGGNSGTEAQMAYYQAFREKYHVIYETQRGWTYEVLRDKVLVTPYGMRFYWPDTSITSSGYITNTPSIFNYPVSNFATGEIIPIALVWLWHALRGWQTQLVLTVHDSVVTETPPDEVEPLKPVLADCFTVRVYETLEKLYHYSFRSVPLAVGIKFGTHWYEGKEITATVLPDRREVVTWKTK